MSRLVLAAVAGTLFLCLASPAIAQEAPVVTSQAAGSSVAEDGSAGDESSQALDPDDVVDPTPPEELGTEADGSVPEEPQPVDSPATLDQDQNTSDTELQTPGYGNAADQSPAAKREEIRTVESKCRANPPPTSTMLGLPGSVAGDEHDSWGWLLIAVAVGLLVLAAIGFAIKARGSDGPVVGLSTAAALVGIVSALAGLAVQFVPGVKVSERPPREATMSVEQVHARITRDEYADKTHSELSLSRQDRREVGNVIWLEIQFRGYQSRRPSLQYALYDSQAAGALLPGTARRVPLRPPGADVETLYVPIWVGYPRSEVFEAEFRLLDGEQVQQMASTGKMAGSTYRYSCEKPA